MTAILATDTARVGPVLPRAAAGRGAAARGPRHPFREARSGAASRPPRAPGALAPVEPTPPARRQAGALAAGHRTPARSISPRGQTAAGRARLAALSMASPGSSPRPGARRGRCVASAATEARA